VTAIRSRFKIELQSGMSTGGSFRDDVNHTHYAVGTDGVRLREPTTTAHLEHQ
jgi:hypothetical protein